MEDKITENDIINLIPLDKANEELAQKIVEEKDLEEVKNLTHAFNLNQMKKNVIRVLKFNSLLDKVSDQMLERFEKCPGQFSNDELLSYLSTTQNAIDRANKSIALVDETPAIQINQVNINAEHNIDRESKERIMKAVQALLNKSKEVDENIIEAEVVDNSEDKDDQI